jgi:hypothetical protein
MNNAERLAVVVRNAIASDFRARGDIPVEAVEINAAKPHQINVSFSNGNEADITVSFVDRTEVVSIDRTVVMADLGDGILTPMMASGVAEAAVERLKDSPVSLSPSEEVQEIRAALDQVPERWRWIPGSATQLPTVISPKGREYGVERDEDAQAIVEEANAVVELRMAVTGLALDVVHTWSALRHSLARQGSIPGRVSGAFLRGKGPDLDLFVKALVRLGYDPERLAEDTQCMTCEVPMELHSRELWEAPRGS